MSVQARACTECFQLLRREERAQAWEARKAAAATGDFALQFGALSAMADRLNRSTEQID